MKHIRTGLRRGQFGLLAASCSAQAAMMVLRPGGQSGKLANEHPRSEQWLYVVAGKGRAIVGRRRVQLKEKSLLLINKGEVHQITNTGRRHLVTLNFYVPPAYDSHGDPK